MFQDGLDDLPVFDEADDPHDSPTLRTGPMQLAESGEWTIEVNIMRKNGETVKRFLSKNTFKTEKEAVYHSTEFGKLIIDEKIPDCSVSDI